jgi:hypothetical protein
MHDAQRGVVSRTGAVTGQGCGERKLTFTPTGARCVGKANRIIACGDFCEIHDELTSLFNAFNRSTPVGSTRPPSAFARRSRAVLSLARQSANLWGQ